MGKVKTGRFSSTIPNYQEVSKITIDAKNTIPMCPLNKNTYTDCFKCTHYVSANTDECYIICSCT